MILPQVHLRNFDSQPSQARPVILKSYLAILGKTTAAWSVGPVKGCWYNNSWLQQFSGIVLLGVRLHGLFIVVMSGFGRLKALTGRKTLLRLLLPLNDQVWPSFRLWVVVADLSEPVPRPHWAIQSVVATGGVYKGQGRNQRKLMTCAY